MNDVVKQVLTKEVVIDPGSEFSPLNPNKHPLEQINETSQKVLNNPQELEFFRKLYQS